MQIILITSILFIIGTTVVQAVSITVTDKKVTATDAPENATLLIALYDNTEKMVGVKTYEGNNTIAGDFANDMADEMSTATKIKAFLWNMTTLTPLCSVFTSEIKDLPDGELPKVLVAYFSCTGTTESVANYILNTIKADKYEIEAAVPYTEDDLKYYTNGRADQEQNNPNARPEIKGAISNIEDYDIIFIGYPIWHGQAPKIIYTFLESYDFSGKTIVPFCTSHSSNIGSSATNLHSICEGSNVIWKTGKRFSSSATNSDVVSWINELGLKLK